MAVYFAQRIMANKLDYKAVITKYGQYKEDIDLILIAEGYSNLITA